MWLFCVHGCLGTFCLPVALRSPNGEVRRGHWNLRTGVPGDCEPPLGYGNLIWVLWKSGQLNLIRPQQLSHHFSPSPPQHRFTFIVFSYVFVGVHVHLYRLSWSHECWIDLLFTIQQGFEKLFPPLEIIILLFLHVKMELHTILKEL